ncbi:pre-60S ribosomal particles component [Elasticomyces elasticus]|uniref:Pre-60S ribosomal particles component n=1 Tax=Elasticomyces elasticus TaxID=574655 RepID=A0AAN7W3K8_9PEZI|nr:pre-60S ribosomal particles component [Elasticomyces elasticus]KAK5728582.1 pre-60S ribosomal particles component [Elasticomyces elasticus]
MAPISKKRSREDKEEKVRRPKKKFKKVKQIDYHSSDDSEVEGAARDAPKEPKREKVIPVSGPNAVAPVPRAEKKVEVVAETVEPKEEVKDVKAKPKSILKQTPPVPEWIDATPEPGDEQYEEVERNTAYNAIPARDNGMFDDEMIHEEGEDGDGFEEDLNDSPVDEENNDEPDLASTDASSEDESVDGDSITSSEAVRQKKKRNDPTAFATSISRILDTKLTTTKRSDPVLSRSKSAADANKTLADNKLEAKARAQIRAEKKAALDRGRVKDVLALETEGVDTGAVQEEEKRLKKTAQRGVVKLFNAVRAAQVKGEEALREARREGVVGLARREERVNEMSKQGFLDLISAGGKEKAAAAA